MKNTLEDLNNHLFAQLERLSDEDLSSEELEKEITRTKAITEVAGKIIDNSSTVLEAMRLVKGKDGIVEKEDLPKMITG
ncbi:hypothetical protein [Fusobacterium varium]|jgi:hypothetical protein|uniref:hypothetical protein n=1 Tax=Fusobacterium varium TaxID=856 RepID=UPI001F16C976|nr:hypothetical protein [Fusobacterium varium]MCF2674620.1 hypothetical protein [Fusobacterium varium]